MEWDSYYIILYYPFNTSTLQADTYQSAQFAQVAAHKGFISGVESVLRKILSTVHGVECLVKEVIEVMNSTIVYLEEIEACGTAVPKEIAKIVKNCRKIIELCENILHLNSTLCASDDDSKVTAPQCFVALLKATSELVLKIDSTIRLIENLPGDTESCFVDATQKVEDSYNNFIPRTNICIDEM